MEFKRALTDATQLARTLIAFANGKGGKLVVGVSDERREVVGIDLTQDLEEWIMNVASTNCRPKAWTQPTCWRLRSPAMASSPGGCLR